MNSLGVCNADTCVEASSLSAIHSNNSGKKAASATSTKSGNGDSSTTKKSNNTKQTQDVKQNKTTNNNTNNNNNNNKNTKIDNNNKNNNKNNNNNSNKNNKKSNDKQTNNTNSLDKKNDKNKKNDNNKKNDKTSSSTSNIEENIKLVMSSTGAGREDALKSLKKNDNDVVQAIIDLQRWVFWSIFSVCFTNNNNKNDFFGFDEMMFCVSFNYLIILILLSFNSYINCNVLQSFLIQKKSSTTTTKTLYENGQLKESTIEFEANQQNSNHCCCWTINFC